MRGDHSRLLELIPAALPRLEEMSCLLGFDATVDVICKPVRDRTGPGESYTPFPVIRDFGEHVVKAEGKSAIVEIVKEREKIGGNGPIMAAALAASGLTVDYLGPLGVPDLHPAYLGFSSHVRTHPVANPAVTHALEFENGKIMLAAMSNY